MHLSTTSGSSSSTTSASVLRTFLVVGTILLLPVGVSGAAMSLRKRPNSLRPPYEATSGISHHVTTTSGPEGPNSTVTTKESLAANPNYWIADRYHGNSVCLLAAFSGTVRVRPSNSSFRGGAFAVSPEVSLGRRANCERHSRHIFWKFSQHDERLLEPEVTPSDDEDDDEVSNSSLPVVRSLNSRRLPVKLIPIEIATRQLSVGFHIVGPMIEFHVAYIECLQPAEKNPATERFRVHSEPRCVNLSVSFDLGSFGDRAGFECSHIWGKTLKDVHYTRDRKLYAGEAQISLEYVKIERDPAFTPVVDGYTFRKKPRRCLADSLLSWQSMAIVGSLATLFIIGFFALCVCSNSSCSDDLSPGSYSGDSNCCQCCTTSGTSWWNRIFCFCCNRKRRMSRRGGRRGELLNRSTYERNLLDRSNQSDDHHTEIAQHHECHAHNNNNNNHTNFNHNHHRHYGHAHNHRHIRRPAPPPLLPPPPPPPSSSSTGTTHVDSELLVLPVGHGGGASECQVLLELQYDIDEHHFDEEEKLIVVHALPPTPRTSTPTSGSRTRLRIEGVATFQYFCACFLLTLSLIHEARRRQTVTLFVNALSLPEVTKNIPEMSSPTRFSTSKYRAHNGSNDHVRSLN